MVPPRDVVRHDGDDPYLVVAADKGTATFSDIANQISADYGFWLGDAFASGGSVGYDHKAMGITARGAWVSVRRHFREMGVDCQNEDFTAVGRRRHVRRRVRQRDALLGAHPPGRRLRPPRTSSSTRRPTRPSSYAERQRLFDLPRSSWQDYDTSLISEGGGVFPRSAKSIPIPAAGARGARHRGPADDPRGADEGDPARAGRPALERRHRHLRQGPDRDPRGGRGQGQRRDPRRRPRAAGQVRRRGGQPRADPARPDRVRRAWRPDQHRLHRQLRRAWTPPTTR